MFKTGAKTQGARLQYDVRELIFVTVLTFLGMYMFLTLLKPTFVVQSYWWRPAEVKWSALLGLTLGISAVTACGCALGGMVARWMRQESMPRFGLMFVGVLCGWAVFAFPTASVCCRWRMAPSEIAGVAYCKTYQEAQDIYHRTDWDRDGVLEYAQNISGAYSLYELTPDTGNLRLVDDRMAQAECGAWNVWFRVKPLNGQGPHVQGGRRSYLKPKPDGSGVDQTDGYALILWPAKYSNDNAPSFIVDAHGVVYFKDLGPDTTSMAERMTEYDPDETWEVAP